MSEGDALAGRIREALAEVEQVVQRAVSLGDRAVASGDTGYWDGVALNLHGYYTAVDRIFEDIARTLDGGLPSGPEWHQRLLLQMSSEVAGRRPPVISRETRHLLDQYRGFRHLVRNLYASSLRPSRVSELLSDLGPSFESLKADLFAFAALLEEAGQRKLT
ncbi:MAG: hypothetical protein HPY83_11360 [Anaerolineae bacterium]|nr:hypothetical protein [Anaerolineae bacterium]